jgi:hypothetical protein
VGTHDLIWNLTPTPAAINLAKSDAVPHLSRYLATFVDQHYAAVPVLKSALANFPRGAAESARSDQPEICNFLQNSFKRVIPALPGSIHQRAQHGTSCSGGCRSTPQFPDRMDLGVSRIQDSGFRIQDRIQERAAPRPTPHGETHYLNPLLLRESPYLLDYFYGTHPPTISPVGLSCQVSCACSFVSVSLYSVRRDALLT